LKLQEAITQLRQVYEAGRRYSFIEQGYRVLAAAPAVPELSWLMVRALAELGLGGPLRELLECREDLQTNPEQYRELQSSLRALGEGKVALEDRAGAYRRNMEAIREHRPALVELAESAERFLSGVEFYRSRQGQWLIARREENGWLNWRGDLSTAESEGQIQLPERGNMEANVIVGVGVGRLLEEIYQRTHRLFLTMSYPLYVVEPDPVRFAAWLFCEDVTEWLADPRVYLFVGEDAVERVERLWEEDERLSLPGNALNLLPGKPTAEQAWKAVERVGEKRNAEHAELVRQLEERYQDRDANYWVERFGREGKVLGITSRFTTMLQYSTRDALAGLKGLGYQTEVLIEERDHEVLPRSAVCRKILEMDPDVVLLLDHLHYEFPHLPDNLPCLTWIQDPLPNLLCRQAGEGIKPFDMVCGYYKPRCVEEFGYPEEQFYSTNIPVSTRVFHNGAIGEADRERYGCDVCFVSHASQTIEAFYREKVAEYPDQIRGLLEALYAGVKKLLADDGYLDVQTTAGDFTRDVATKNGWELPEETLEHLKTHFVYRLWDWGRRQQSLEWVADWARRTGRVLKIYGKGWEHHPRLGEFAAGVAEHGEELRKILRASKIALQLIPAGFRHQRSLEALACGTLVLNRYCPSDFAHLSIEEFVEQRAAGMHQNRIAALFPGLERIVFRNAGEFESLAESFLQDEGYYEEVMAELRGVVMREYTYEAVMSRVMNVYRENVVRQAENMFVGADRRRS